MNCRKLARADRQRVPPLFSAAVAAAAGSACAFLACARPLLCGDPSALSASQVARSALPPTNPSTLLRARCLYSSLFLPRFLSCSFQSTFLAPSLPLLATTVLVI